MAAGLRTVLTPLRGVQILMLNAQLILARLILHLTLNMVLMWAMISMLRSPLNSQSAAAEADASAQSPLPPPLNQVR